MNGNLDCRGQKNIGTMDNDWNPEKMKGTLDFRVKKNIETLDLKGRKIRHGK
jgi:hypothetical protein